MDSDKGHLALIESDIDEQSGIEFPVHNKILSPSNKQ